MITNSKSLKPARIVTPGAIIADEIEARGWTQEDLSDILGLSIQTVNKLIKNKTSITTETAVALGAALGQSTEFWLNLDARYRSLKFADKEQEVMLKAAIYNQIPVNEMSKRGWIDKNNLLNSVLTFFKRSSWAEIEKVGIAELAFRKSEAFEERFDQNAASCWFQRAKNVSETLKVPSYDSVKLKELSAKICHYTVRENGVADFLDALTDCGVKFFVLAHLPKTFTDGAAFYVSHTPTIVYTARYKRLDNFWFTIAHEISHILYHLNTEMWFIIESDSSILNQMEKEANEEAQRLLKYADIYEALHGNIGHLTSSQILSVADKIGVHPSIVIGAMSRVKDQYYKRLNEFKGDLMSQIPEQYHVEK
jgi:HTH-type transcriptional regulator / antitoxin HigA